MRSQYTKVIVVVPGRYELKKGCRSVLAKKVVKIGETGVGVKVCGISGSGMRFFEKAFFILLMDIISFQPLMLTMKFQVSATVHNEACCNDMPY